MRTIVIFLVLFLGIQSQAQKSTADPRLSLRFSEAQISKMDDARMSYWTYYLDNSFTIMEIPAEKASQLDELEILEISSADFHGFSMILDAYHKDGAYLKFKGENKMVAIKPISQFTEEFNTFFQAAKK